MNNNDFDFTRKNSQGEETPFYTSDTFNESNSGYDTKPVRENYPKLAAEVPLPKKPKLSVIIMIIVGVLFFLFMLCFVALGGNRSGYSGLMVQFAAILVFSALTIAAPFIDRYCLKKVCTVRTKGIYVGFDTRQRASRYGNYNVYAPKYEIFINGHYEIRTLDDFSRSLDFTGEIELLANPDGYEIMPADGKISRSGKRNIILVLVILVVIMIVAMPFLVKRVFWNGGFI